MDRDAMERLIAKNEGWKTTTYTDTAGHPTVGVGFNLDRSDAAAKIEALGLDYDKVRSGEQSLTDAQVNTLFQGDLDTAVSGAQGLISNFDDLNDARQTVVVDMVFNLGATQFSQFTNTIGAIEDGDWDRAADEMQDSNWYDQVGNRSEFDVNTMRAGDDATGYL
jgi:GH24 family phage-related lysozyme (muramidase)